MFSEFLFYTGHSPEGFQDDTCEAYIIHSLLVVGGRATLLLLYNKREK